MGSRILFSDADLVIGDGDRIGLVGPNGCGKTTLLRTLMGEAEPERGEIMCWRGLRPAYLQQLVAAADQEMTVQDFVRRSLPAEESEYQAHRVDLTLDEMGFPPSLRAHRLGQLSGGWQRLAQLAAIWVADPNLLLLDEPTNFLDIEKVLQFEAWLRDTVTCPVLIISHDRELLDACTNRTLVIHDGALQSISHPFSEAMAIVQERIIAEQKARDSQEKEIRRLTFTYKRLQHWGHTFNVKKLSRRAKSIAKRVDRMSDELPRAAAADKRRIALQGGGVSSDYLVKVSDYDVSAPDGRVLFHIDTLMLHPGDRMVILGRNGIGKTTLIRLLDRWLAERDGPGQDRRVSLSPQARPAYFDQDLEALPARQSPLAYLETKFGGNRTGLISAMVRIGIPYDKVDHPIATLSGGQRSRLLLLAMQMRDPNLYLLDEPTNHIDIQGMEQLEYELVSRDLTAVIVSHDRRFIAEVGTRFLMIADGRLSEIDDPQSFYDGLAQAPEPTSEPAGRKAKTRVKSPAVADCEAVLAEILDLEARHPQSQARPEAVRRRLAALYSLLSPSNG